MAGPALDGQLSETPLGREGVRYAVATEQDDAAIRRLLRDNPMGGDISLSFEREPNYFAGTPLGAAEYQTIVAYAQDRLLCLGRCTTRFGWLNAQPQRIAYLGELRLDASARGRISLLRDGYAFFRRLQADTPANFYFTSIASDNLPARRLLEHGLARMPRYEFLTEMVTLVIPASSAASGARAEVTTANYEELADFFNREGARHQLATVWDVAGLRALQAHGLRRDDFKVIRDSGRIVAAGALWDQRAFRQIVIRSYARRLRYSRPLVNLAARVFGTPALPPIGSVLAQGFASPLACAPGHESVFPALVRALAREASQRRLAFLSLAFAARDPRLSLIRRFFSARRYSSRLYRVSWPDEPEGQALDSRDFAPDLAFL